MGKLNKKAITNHSVAPYNFISLPSNAIAPYNSIEELPVHNVYNDQLLNGFIEFEIIAKTPLIVAKNKDSQGDARFFTNPKDEKVIPGNTIRGLLRTNASVLSMSNIEDEIVDSRFYFRSFDKSKTAKEYKNRLRIRAIKDNKTGSTYSKAETIEAGFIYKKGKNEYVIVPSKKIGGEQFYRVSEQYLRRMAKNIKINYMYNERIKELIDNKKEYKGKQNNRKKKNFLKGIANRNYKPYCTEISFELGNKREVKKVDKSNVYKNKGYILSSKYIMGKLGHYVINEPNYDSENILELNERNNNIKFIEFYKDDYIRTKKDNSRESEFFSLPKEIGVENGNPIFYGEFKGNVYLGYTPYFRIPYDKSIKEGISSTYLNNQGLSYCDGLFGFSNKIDTNGNKISYKGRISVEDAKYEGQIPVESKIEESNSYEVVLGEPKASCFANYLMQEGVKEPKELNTYNSEEFKIRGIKQYWQKEFIELASARNQKMKVYLHPIKIGSKFKGKIHFNNLKKEELGLVLWALKIKENAHENIGLGKPYGFGRVELRNIAVKVEDLKDKYSSMAVEFHKDIEREELVKHYKQEFKNNFNIEIENQPSFKELVKMKTVVISEDKYNEGRYMELKEFTNKLPLLSTLKQAEIIEDKKVNSKMETKVKKNFNDGKQRHYNNKSSEKHIPNNKKKNKPKENKVAYSDSNQSINSEMEEKLRALGLIK